MGYVKDIIEKFLRLQDKFYPDAKDYMDMGKGKVSMIKVVGSDGESMLLKVNGTRIVKAEPDDKPVDIFKCTTDTFLDVVAGDVSLREAITRGHFTIENAQTMAIDVIECEKWAQAFERLRSVIDKVVKA